MSNWSDTEGGVMPGDDIWEGGLRVGGKSESNWRETEGGVMPAGDEVEGTRSNNRYSPIIDFNDVLMGSAGRSLAGRQGKRAGVMLGGQRCGRSEGEQLILCLSFMNEFNDIPALIQWHSGKRRP